MLRLLEQRVSEPHRTTPPQQVHITVHFIGGVPRRELDRTVESVGRAIAGLTAFTLEPCKLISLPARGAPRLVALETSAPPPLPELHRRLVQRFALRPKDAKRDRFLPHFTLARYPHEARPARMEEAVRLESIPVREVRLMSSVLRPEGAVHTAVASWPLSL
jgi:2'-5' RNA ligase